MNLLDNLPPTISNAGETSDAPNAQPKPASTGKGINPGKRLRAIEAAAKTPLSQFKLPRGLKFQREKLPMAYWNVTGTLSLIVNVVLIAILILLSREIYFLKRVMVQDVLGGLAYNFSLMDQASIGTNIPVQTDITVDFPLEINQPTFVTLTEDTHITGAHVTISAGILSINNAPASITLPAGSRLPIQLNMTVLVKTTVPITLNVPVDIPLNKTELHTPFIGLQGVVTPYLTAFWQGPFKWEDSKNCKSLPSLCGWWFH